MVIGAGVQRRVARLIASPIRCFGTSEYANNTNRLREVEKKEVGDFSPTSLLYGASSNSHHGPNLLRYSAEAVVEPAAGAFGSHPVMLPVMEENRKFAPHGAAAQGPGRTKSVAVGFATVPVGSPPGITIPAKPGFFTIGAPPTSPR